MSDSSSLGDSSAYDEEESEEEEVRYNILDREKRVTAGRRYNKLLAGIEAEKDAAFWGNKEHATWVEEDDDSSVSFRSDEEEDIDDDSMSSEADLSESSESEEVVEEKSRRTAKNKYVDPALLKKKKPQTVKRIIEEKEEQISERMSLREKSNRSSIDSGKPDIKKPAVSKVAVHKMTQEELLEEAKLTEQINTAALNAYISYEEITEKPAKKRNFQAPSFVLRSFIENGEERCELRFKGGALWGQLIEKKSHQSHSAKYKDPYTGRYFNTTEEFHAIRREQIEQEGKDFSNTFAYLQTHLDITK